MREMDTLPFRTGLIRARFQSQIDESENAVNKLTTTALVERPPLQFKVTNSSISFRSVTTSVLLVQV